MSLLEWMMTKIPFYGRIPQDEEDELGEYNPKIITKLLKNYRSHPSILEVRYYDKNQQSWTKAVETLLEKDLFR